MGKLSGFCCIFLLILSVFSSFLFSQSTEKQQVNKFTIHAPQLKTDKQIWVYLPKNYQNSENAYPVIYMHDAQNLFDAQTSFAGEWQIDEFLDNFEGSESIIVGIEHGNDKRLDELTPFSNNKYGGGQGNAYLNFIVETLKPYIDTNFRTLSENENTSIVGSSLGGLLSFYAILKYPEVFGNAGVFSPSFWFSEDIYTFASNTSLAKVSRFYFVTGTEESENAVPNQQKMVNLLLEKGVDKENIVNNIIQGGRHNEAFWSAQFPDAYIWLTNQ
ncbi:alpha/beta hydrolase [Paucihalobacter ruber]|uniref:Alpha/beta hydrolase n=1 Tax=Paucihalobacter ruber TaxID=2567861 RepID=A0A506PG81_9FLAO|nr:alpha/beta hydrolase-fold protein [Paucihalobacter ruber]TPV32846.1 alpha/beta hydrolase [Paucihalobacter ruber]